MAGDDSREHTRTHNATLQTYAQDSRSPLRDFFLELISRKASTTTSKGQKLPRSYIHIFFFPSFMVSKRYDLKLCGGGAERVCTLNNVRYTVAEAFKEKPSRMYFSVFYILRSVWLLLLLADPQKLLKLLSTFTQKASFIQGCTQIPFLPSCNVFIKAV